MCLVVVALAVVVRSIGRSPQPTRPGTIDALATSSDACVTCHRKSSPGIVEQYGHRWLWLPTVGGTFAMVVATVLGMIERPTRTDLWTYVGAMILLLAIGAVGAVLHLWFNLGPSRQLVPEPLLKGAPLMAPLLFGNMGLVGLVALLPEREHVG